MYIRHDHSLPWNFPDDPLQVMNQGAENQDISIEKDYVLTLSCPEIRAPSAWLLHRQEMEANSLNKLKFLRTKIHLSRPTRHMHPMTLHWQ